MGWLSQIIVTHAHAIFGLNFALSIPKHPKSLDILGYLGDWNLELRTIDSFVKALCFIGWRSKHPRFQVMKSDAPWVPSPEVDPPRLARRTSGQSDSEWDPTNSRSARRSWPFFETTEVSMISMGPWDLRWIHSGYLTVCHGKSQFLIGKPSINGKRLDV